ncbi:ribbon-helix-helix domain-containing protein [Scytonema sp. PCC 10023]|uniref:ribbon-helix-helix domain-containing protein n=1 Tax=Scytonema sp. PCC 10023 TaxID=1680591 RepID=UPI0039C6FD3B
MAKKTNLAAALQEVSGKPTAPEPKPQQVQQVETPKPPPSRQGKKAIAGHFDPAVSRQLRQLALEQDTTVQGLLAEALNDLFEKYGKKPIA